MNDPQILRETSLTASTITSPGDGAQSGHLLSSISKDPGIFQEQLDVTAIILSVETLANIEEVTNGCPLGLIPLANKQLLAYQLEWLNENKVKDVMIVCDRRNHSKISRYSAEFYKGSQRIEVIGISNALNLQTAQILRIIAPRLPPVRVDINQRNLMIIPGDLVTDISLTRVLQTHRVADSSFTVCFLKMQEDAKKGKSVSHLLLQKADVFDVYGTVSQDKLSQGTRVVFASTNHGSSTINRALFARHSRIQIRSDLEDTQIYVMKRWVPQFLVTFACEEGELEDIVGIQDALLPFLASNQHSRRLREFALKHNGGQKPGMLQFLGKFSNVLDVDQEMIGAVNEMLGFANTAEDDGVKVLGVVEDFSKITKRKLLRRIGTDLKAYLDTNTMSLQQNAPPLFRIPSENSPVHYLKQFKPTIEKNQAEKKPFYQDLPQQVKQVVFTTRQIGLTSNVCPDIDLKNKASIQRSSVGRDVKIGAKSTITNSIIFNHVTIGDEQVKKQNQMHNSKLSDTFQSYCTRFLQSERSGDCTQCKRTRRKQSQRR